MSAESFRDAPKPVVPRTPPSNSPYYAIAVSAQKALEASVHYRLLCDALDTVPTPALVSQGAVIYEITRARNSFTVSACQLYRWTGGHWKRCAGYRG